MSPRNICLTLIALSAVLMVISIVRLSVGQSFGWPGGDPLATFGQWVGLSIDDDRPLGLMDLRLLRLALALVAGAALAVSGVALQTLLRNVLAEPFILGLSSGAAMGMMAQAVMERTVNHPLGPGHAGALLGASGSMLIVFIASRRRGMVDPLGLLLVGVVVSTINGAVIMLLNYLSDSAGLRADIARWMMGYLNEAVGLTSFRVVGVVTVIGLVVLLVSGRSMDVATCSDAEAMSLGVNLARLRVLLFVVASALAAGAVVLAGPIAFVGLICPHFARLWLGPGHRALLIGSALLGGMLLVLADLGSVVLDFGQGRLPLGIFTALIGGPVFIAMLRPKLGRGV